MKTKVILFLVCMLTATSWAQNGINYKAVIKDGSGNIFANENIDIRFTIELYNTAIYQEEQPVTTDDNGIINLNIGEGTTTDDFSTIPWNSIAISLNVEVDIGDGWVDMGDSTTLKLVPYAHHSLTSSQSNTSIDSEKILMFESGGSNPDKMVIQHSNLFSDWGLQYSDSDDKFNFLSQGIARLTVDLNSGDLNTEGNLTTDGLIGIGTSNPLAKLHLKQEGITISNGLRLQTSLTTNEDWYLYMNSEDNLTFNNDGIDFLTLQKNTGNIGVGTTNPSRKLSVNGTGLFTGTLNVGDIWVGGYSKLSSAFVNSSSRLTVSSSIIPSTEFFYSLGASDKKWLAVWATNGTINTSDRRDKTNIKNMSYGLDEIMKLKPVSFSWKERQGNDIKLGLIAQDLLKVIPEVVKTHEDIKDEKTGVMQRREIERMGVFYSDLVPVLIKAIQEQQVTINSLNKLSDTQKTERQALQKNYLVLLSRIEALESSIPN